jgi:hypothetical protein
LVYLETMLVSVQDRSTACGKRTIGLGIVLGTPDGATRCGSSGRSFGIFGDSANLNAR